MKHGFFLVPTEMGVGLTSVSLGLVRALDQLGLRREFLQAYRSAHRQPGPVDHAGVEHAGEGSTGTAGPG